MPPTETEPATQAPEQEVPKASVSGAIIKPVGGDGGHLDCPMGVETQEEEMSETSRFKLKADFFQTDTKGVEDLYDTAGADTTTFKPTFIASGVADPEEGEQGTLDAGRFGDTASIVTRVRQSKDNDSLPSPAEHCSKNILM